MIEFFLQREAFGLISHVSKLVNSARKSVIDSDMIYDSVSFPLSKKIRHAGIVRCMNLKTS